jgi:CBS-domain-containing membrane protein
LEDLQTISHFPFPAKLVSPENNVQVSLEKGSLMLSWEAVDLDDDIERYDVYMGLDPDDLTIIKENLTSNSISVSLNTDQIYYWKVVTRDREENISHSEVGVFRTSP